MTRSWHNGESILAKFTSLMKRDTNLDFSQARTTALILLNYRYDPIGRLDVNAVIIDHIQQ